MPARRVTVWTRRSTRARPPNHCMDETAQPCASRPVTVGTGPFSRLRPSSICLEGHGRRPPSIQHLSGRGRFDRAVHPPLVSVGRVELHRPPSIRIKRTVEPLRRSNTPTRALRSNAVHFGTWRVREMGTWVPRARDVEERRAFPRATRTSTWAVNRGVAGSARRRPRARSG